MNLDEILNLVPAFEEFMTVDELDESSRELAEEYRNVKLLRLASLRRGDRYNVSKLEVENAMRFFLPIRIPMSR